MSSKFQEMSLFCYELLAQTVLWCWFNTLLAYYNLKMLHFLNCSIITTTHLPHLQDSAPRATSKALPSFSKRNENLRVIVWTPRKSSRSLRNKRQLVKE